MICFHWVDLDLEVHEEFFGLYQVSDISSDTIMSVITDTAENELNFFSMLRTVL